MIHGAIGLAHRTQPEVVRPAAQLAVQAVHDLGHVWESSISAGLFAEGFAELLDLLPRGSSAHVGSASLRRTTLRAVPAPSERVTQEVERLVRDTALLRRLLVHRQLDPSHHVPHREHGLFGHAFAADREVGGGVDDASLQTLFVAQRRVFKTTQAAPHETPHVQIRQERRQRCPLHCKHRKSCFGEKICWPRKSHRQNLT